MNLPFTSLFGVATLLALPAGAGDLYVNVGSSNCAAGTGTLEAPFCTLQEALAVALDGDTIHIAAGIYRETLQITVDVALVGTEGEELTILDPGATPGAAVTIENGADVTLTGLTIRNAAMAGVRVLSSSPPAVLAISNSTISGNRRGGVSNANGTLTLTDTTLDSNTFFSEPGYGGGLYNGTGDVTLNRCAVTNNKIIALTYPSGGGIHSKGVLTVIDSTIDDNEVVSTTRSTWFAYGGGVFVDTGGVAVLRNTSISGNATKIPNAYFGGFATGAGIYNRGDLSVTNCLLVKNTLYPSWPGSTRIIESSTGTLRLDASTLAGSYPSSSSRVAVQARSDSVVSNTIVWGNVNPLTSASQIQGAGSLPAVFHSDVQGGWEGPGAFNLTQDPLFSDAAGGDYTLSASSALIDQGSPDSALLGRDLAGGSRLNDGDLDRSMLLDIGAYEFSHVTLDVTGDFSPGGSLTVDATGTAGLPLLLAVGQGAEGTRWSPLGIVFLDLAAPIRVVSLDPIPSATVFPIPPTLVGPTQVTLQLLAFGPPPPMGKRAANVSNPVSVILD